MKIWKWLLIIGVAVNIGLVIFQTMPKEGKDHGKEGHHEDAKAKDGHGHDESKEEEGHHEDTGKLELSKESQELIGLKTIEAKLSRFVERISVTGQIAQDVEQTTHISPHQAGTLAECKTEMGKVVKKDDVLCLVRTNGNAESVVEVKSPVDGVIISDFAKKGDKVDSITSLHTVADLSKLLATFDVYEKDIAKIKTGQRIVLHSVAYPDKTFEGEIIYVSPRVDEHTNTVKIRAEVFNPEYLLKLGMFVTAEVIIESNEDYVVVPQEAVHIVGDKRVVFIKTGEHDFDVRVVTVKIESKDASAIEGVKEGEVVVAQDGFLLKSELLKSQMGEGCAE